MIPSSNNFNKNQPTKSGSSFADAITRSSNSFARTAPTKSGNTFADAIQRSTNTFSTAAVIADNHVFDGDNTSAGPYGGDFDTFGQIYGQDNFGGIVHFQNRPAPPVINH